VLNFQKLKFLLHFVDFAQTAGSTKYKSRTEDGIEITARQKISRPNRLHPNFAKFGSKNV